MHKSKIHLNHSFFGLLCGRDETENTYRKSLWHVIYMQFSLGVLPWALMLLFAFDIVKWRKELGCPSFVIGLVELIGVSSCNQPKKHNNVLSRRMVLGFDNITRDKCWMYFLHRNILQFSNLVHFLKWQGESKEVHIYIWLCNSKQ